MTSLIKRDREDVSLRGCAHAGICAREDVRTVVFGKKHIFRKMY